MTFDVIVPVHNSAKTLETTVLSLIQQTHPFQKIILVENGSRDNSVQVAQVLAQQFKNIEVHSIGARNAAEARNYGLEQATSDWIFFIDADDTVAPKLVEKVMTAVEEQNKQPDLVHYNFVQEFPNGTEQVNPYFLPAGAYGGREFIQKMLESFRHETKHMVWSFSFKRNYLFENKMKFPKLSMFEDIAYLHKLFQLNPQIIVIDSVLVTYKYHKTSATNKEEQTFLTDLVRLKKQMIEDGGNNVAQTVYLSQLGLKILSEDEYIKYVEQDGVSQETARKTYKQFRRKELMNKIKRKLFK